MNLFLAAAIALIAGLLMTRVAGKCSNKGHPHHPLYLRKDEKTCDFDIEAYLEALKA